MDREREEMPSCTPTTHLRSVSSPPAMENVSRPEEDEIRAWGTSTSFTLAGEREKMRWVRERERAEMGEGEGEREEMEEGRDVYLGRPSRSLPMTTTRYTLPPRSGSGRCRRALGRAQGRRRAYLRAERCRSTNIMRSA
jgi:hypothetical protein